MVDVEMPVFIPFPDLAKTIGFQMSDTIVVLLFQRLFVAL